MFGLALAAGGGFLRDAALAAAHDLGVPAALATPRGLDALADALGLGDGRRRLRPLLDVLVALGVLARDDERYRLAQVPPRPAVAAAGWGLLARVIRDDRPLPEDDSAEGLARYHQHLLGAGAAAATELMTALPAGSLVELGAGAGVYSAAYLEAHAGGRATLVDRPEVLSLARAHLDQRGLAARATLVAGDAAVAALGRDHQVALLANLLHLHPPAMCLRLIARAAAAVVPGGLVVVKDLRLDDDRRGSIEGLWFALDMALYTDGGDVHTTGSLTAWLRAAGLVDVEARALVATPDGIVVTGRRPSPAPPR